MIGETTPGTFYEALTESMMEDGFLSRFLIVGYDGDRPEENKNILVVPDEAILLNLAAIAEQATSVTARGESQLVGRTEEAAAIMAAFSDEANANIRKTDDESRRQMWNRAALKSFRIAALLAVGDSFTFPVIKKEHIEWAIAIVRQDIAMMQKRLDSGDVGQGDTTRQRKLMTIIKDYRDKEGDLPKSYKVNPAMRANFIVPKHFLQMRTQQVAAFYNHKLGQSRALNETIQQCIESGYLMEVKPDKLVEGYNYHGRAYRILEIPDYQAMSEK
jgi:hypothetical protein